MNVNIRANKVIPQTHVQKQVTVQNELITKYILKYT